jgi:6-phosphogluconate dehydrogenase (decarboxylating)
MQLGMIGLGRMGANMARRLVHAGHQCVVYDLNPENVKHLAGEGAIGAASLEDFVDRLTRPRAAWLMVPAEVLSASLYTRFRSRQEHTFAEKFLAAMRFKFGGHVERPTGGKPCAVRDEPLHPATRRTDFGMPRVKRMIPEEKPRQRGAP